MNFLKTMFKEKISENLRKCPRFEWCSANICPLDLEVNLRSKLPGENQCPFTINKKSKSQKGDIIANFGILSPTKGSAKFAFLKGAIDGGLKVIHSPDAFPDEARIKGKHIEAYVAAKKDRLQFSKSHDAKNVSKIFDEVKKKIESI